MSRTYTSAWPCTVARSVDVLGDRLTGPEGSPLVLHHTGCDHDMHAMVVCSECQESLDVRQVSARPGPGAGA